MRALGKSGIVASVLAAAALLSCAAGEDASVALRGSSVAMPTERQLQFLDEQINQFSHWGINTMLNWNASVMEGNYGSITWHDCKTVQNSSSANVDAPCLGRDIWNPDLLDTDQWVQASVAMGMRTILLTAQHEGGWCLWDTATTNYSAPNSPWGKSTGRVPLLEFVKSCHKYGMRVGYYFNIQCAHWEVEIRNSTPSQFLETQLGKLKELLNPPYTPSRLWFDGTSGYPKGFNISQLWDEGVKLIRKESPSTLIGPYKGGDVCYRPLTSVYGGSGPGPNTSSPAPCSRTGDPTGPVFNALEAHGATMQEGPQGTTNGLPTFWFWHDSVLFGPARRLFNSYLATVGHGKTLNLNIAANERGVYNSSMVKVMQDFGRARNDTFQSSLGGIGATSGKCGAGGEEDFVIDLSGKGVTVKDLDYVSIREDLARGGQRISNYTLDYRVQGDSEWKTLIQAPTCYPWQDKHCVNAPNCNLNSTKPPEEGWHALAERDYDARVNGRVGDTPSSSYPRDAFIGSLRFDCPKSAGGPWYNGAVPASTVVGSVRFRCLDSVLEGKDVYIRDITLHTHKADFPPPWEQ